MTTHKIDARIAAFSLGLTLAGLTPSAAAINVAQSPLFLTASVDANFMITLDNSDSMLAEILPDGYVNQYGLSAFLYPKPANVYGSSDPASGGAVSFDDRFALSRVVRSSQLNSIYYNPAVTYQPWLTYDGSSYPNALPSAAPNNPVIPGAGVRDLTNQASDNVQWDLCHKIGACTTGSPSSPWTWTITLPNRAPVVILIRHSESYCPAVYYTYNGGDIWTIANYTPTFIVGPGTSCTDPSGTRHAGTDSYAGSTARTDCAAAPTCTYAEEIQNFANWYTYYRSRILTIRGGIGSVLAKQSQHLRVGFGTIGQGAVAIDGIQSPGTIVLGLREFSGTNRSNLFDAFYGAGGSSFLSSTPLRQALDDVGQYFLRRDNQGPWSATPGTANNTPQLECRQSFNVLATDGYWNGNGARTTTAQGNVDGSAGPAITGPNNQNYQYTPDPPYQDSSSGTLADVAMYYWYQDLRPDLLNQVPSSTTDAAFWQHLVNFTVGLGVTGTLNPLTDLGGLTAGTTSWPQPVANTNTTIDDLWHAALNSRGQFFSATDPKSLASALVNALGAVTVNATSSGSALTANTSTLGIGAVVYEATFDSSDWSGSLLAFAVDPTNGNLVDGNGDGNINALDNIWNASLQIPAFATRRNQVFTWNPSTNLGVPFAWANLSTTQQAALKTVYGTVDPAALGNTRALQRLDYLLGDQSNELTAANPAGIFRKRARLLGDIINSDPIFVGADDYGYTLLPTAEGSSYFAYLSSIAQRRRMVYAGGNDGMLHAFDAGSYDAAANPPGFNTGTGVEQFAYVPNAVFGNLTALTSTNYTHLYYVDGSPAIGDAYLGGAWKTVLVGTTGRGGAGVFALDVTAPNGFGASNVLWDVSTASSPNAADLADVGTTPGFANGLGYTLPQPSIVRLYDGSWAVIVANGYGSASNKAVLYIISLADGHIIRAIDTLAGSPGSPNGLSTPMVVDIDNDRIADYIYAGDLQGNLWKFDVKNATAANWNIPYSSVGAPAPLFAARDANGVAQPITAQPQVGYGPYGLGTGFMIYFGTGKYFEVGDNVLNTNNAGVVTEQIQTFYGLWDKNTLTASDQISGRGQLQVQTIDAEISQNGYQLRTTSNNPVDYSTKLGWYMDLLQSSGVPQGERVVDFALLRNGNVIFTTLIPSSDPCAAGGDGWLMELNATYGQRLTNAPWDITGDNQINNSDMVTVGQTTMAPSGVAPSTGILFGPPAVIAGSGSLEYKKTGVSGATPSQMTESAGAITGRQSWQQLQ